MLDLPLLHFIKNNRMPGISGNTGLIGRGKGRQGWTLVFYHLVHGHVSVCVRSLASYFYFGACTGMYVIGRENFLWRRSSLVLSECLTVSPRLTQFSTRVTWHLFATCVTAKPNTGSLVVSACLSPSSAMYLDACSSASWCTSPTVLNFCCLWM